MAIRTTAAAATAAWLKLTRAKAAIERSEHTRFFLCRLPPRLACALEMSAQRAQIERQQLARFRAAAVQKRALADPETIEPPSRRARSVTTTQSGAIASVDAQAFVAQLVLSSVRVMFVDRRSSLAARCSLLAHAQRRTRAKTCVLKIVVENRVALCVAVSSRTPKLHTSGVQTETKFEYCL